MVIQFVMYELSVIEACNITPFRYCFTHERHYQKAAYLL